MKTCPHCKSEVDNHFESCWNCQYSFTGQKIHLEPEPDPTHTKTQTDIHCLRCYVPMQYYGVFRFQGEKLGDLSELLIDGKVLRQYNCPNCGKVEFFLPK